MVLIRNRLLGQVGRMILLCIPDGALAIEVVTQTTCTIETDPDSELGRNDQQQPHHMTIVRIEKNEQIILPPSFCQHDRAKFIAAE